MMKVKKLSRTFHYNIFNKDDEYQRSVTHLFFKAVFVLEDEFHEIKTFFVAAVANKKSLLQR